MGLRVSHRPDYHEWARSTPVIDAIGTVVAFASVVIGGYAALFLVMAIGAGRWDVAADDALIFLFIALANGAVDAARHWYRHHG
jgi:formate-dependent nitrite reductase membrane component NrfD